MVSRYLKANRTAKRASGKDHFLYENDVDAILAIMDADMFENNKDMESEIVMCKNYPLGKIVRSDAIFVRKFIYPKHVYQGTRKQNI